MSVFYLDLDRTVFRTDKVGELFAAIEHLYPRNDSIKGGYNKRCDYYVFAHADQGDDMTYYHDMVAQLRDAGLDATAVFARLRAELADGRFEYPDLAECVHTLQRYGTVKVLTYGEDKYQRLKAALCPSLEGIEVVTLIGPKAEYLATHAASGDWIIDDKRLANMPKGVGAVYIQHNEQEPADVHSLPEAVCWIVGHIDIKA